MTYELFGIWKIIFHPTFHCASNETMILVNFEDIGAGPSGFCQLIQIDHRPTLSSTQAGFNAIRQIIWDNLWQLREIIQFLFLDKDVIIVLRRSKCTVVTFYCRKFAEFAFFDRGWCFYGLDLGWEVSIVQSCIKRRQAINQLHEKNPLLQIQDTKKRELLERNNLIYSFVHLEKSHGLSMRAAIIC